MIASLLGDLHAAQHSRQLLDSLGPAQLVESGTCTPAISEFDHPHMVIGLACDLREMRHAQHLRAFSQKILLPADDFRHAPANSGVDFIEDQAGSKRLAS